MVLRLFVTGIICFLLSPAACAQRLIFKNYTVSDGMVANPIRKIFQDSRGFIWICTWEGLSKYDGNKFTNYTTANGLSDNSVNDVYETAEGKLYVALNTGITDLLEHDIITKKAVFRNIVINSFYASPAHHVFAVTDTSGIWELKNGGLTKPTQEEAGDSYSKMTSVNDSFLAVCSPEIPFRLFDRSLRMVAESKTPISISECIFQDRQKRIWVGTSKGLELFSLSGGQKPELKRLKLPVLFPSNHIALPSTLIEEPNGNLWIGMNEGLGCLRPDGLWTLYTEKDGLPSKQITCLFQDREKNIWVGTTLGMAKLSSQNDIHMYTTLHGLKNNDILKVYTDGSPDKIFVGTPYEGRTQIQMFDVAENKFRPDLTNITARIMSAGFPFLFSNNDLGVFNQIGLWAAGKSKKLNADQFCGIAAIGHIFMGTDKGIVVADAKGVAMDTTLRTRVQTLLFDRHKCLWIGTWEKGLYRICPEGFNQYPYVIENLNPYLPDKNIRTLYEDSEGNIWIGTRYKGVVELVPKGAGYQPRRFDQTSGLASNFIRAIKEDGAGNIWLGSFFGIDKLVKKADGFKVFNFSRINNYFGIVNDILCTKKNEIWCATTEGLVHIRDRGLDSTSPLSVYLSSVFLAGKRVDVGKAAPSLPYAQNQANFEFSAADFINEKQVAYSHRLLGGSDSSWSTPANLHEVSYASLEPGDYLFQVRTLGWNGIYGPPTSFRFTVLAPFWKTWWFFLLISLASVAFFFWLYRYRITQLLRVQTVRNRLATDLHDDIGSTLTNISILSELGRKSLHYQGETSQFLERITEEADSSSQALDDIIWSVNSRNDTMEETLVRMRRYAAELFDNTETNCHIDLENIPGKKMDMEQRRDFYLIYKESLNNIYKHASARNVWVKSGFEHRSIKLSIIDDGKGFVTSQPSHRNGLRNLRWRAQRWKGAFDIESKIGSGTRITISMPVHSLLK